MTALRTSARMVGLAIFGLLGNVAAGSPPPASPAASAAAPSPASADKLVIHEWGTFTALQDERGRSIHGINTDDEPLPNFVHRTEGVMQPPGEMPPVQFKGISRVHPDVIVRLETPVLYFYPPKDSPPLTLDVKVAMRDGWLTEFYPKAVADNPNLRGDQQRIGSIPHGKSGSLLWQNLRVAGRADGPKTTSRVWVAPREVDSTSVTTPAGESERYLFYRGVAAIDPPLSVTRAGTGGETLKLQVDPKRVSGEKFGPIWLVDVREDGAIAYRAIEGLGKSGGPTAGASTPSAFANDLYAKENLAGLRKEMKTALTGEGLFAAEGEAMLNTWEVSYFRRPGLRVFYVVPRSWTDSVLPLQVTSGGAAVSADITRVMVGRIEVVTPAQRQRLTQIGHTAPSDPRWLWQAMSKMHADRGDAYREEWYRQIFAGEKSMLAEDIVMPPEFKSYLQLGRFRNALVLDELAQRPTPELKKFVEQYELMYADTRPAKAAPAVTSAVPTGPTAPLPPVSSAK